MYKSNVFLKVMLVAIAMGLDVVINTRNLSFLVVLVTVNLRGSYVLCFLHDFSGDFQIVLVIDLEINVHTNHMS